MAQPFRRAGAVGKPLGERLVVTTPGRDPQRTVGLPDALAPWVDVAAPELEALLPDRLGNVKQPANPETHFGALVLHPIEQLLDVDPRPVKLQGGPLRSSDDSNQPSFVVMFVFRGLIDGANEVGSIIINVITGLPLRGATRWYQASQLG